MRGDAVKLTSIPVVELVVISRFKVLGVLLLVVRGNIMGDVNEKK